MSAILLDLAPNLLFSLSGRLLGWLFGGAGKTKLSLSDSGVTPVASDGIAEVHVYAEERNAAVPYVLKTGLPSLKCGIGTDSEGSAKCCGAVAVSCGADRSMTILKVLSLDSVVVLLWSSRVEKEYERPDFAVTRGWIGFLVVVVLDRLIGAASFSEL